MEQLDSLLDVGEFEPVDMAPDEVAMVLYTSGSTGLPKGVPLTHGGYIWATGATPEQRPGIEGQKIIIAAPLFHMNGLFSAKMVMINGGTIVLLTSFTARGYIRAIDRQRVAMVTSVPTMLALVMRETEELAKADLSCVTTAVTGSAPSTPEFFEQMHRLFPKAETANSWGTTESGPLGFGPHPDGVAKPMGSLGYPRGNVEVKFVGGAETGATQGVLHIRTPALMSGYLNRETDTKKRLIDGWYDTGDVMRRDENGFVFFVGRADDMFQCGGENVYPGEVEKLLGQHPEVAQACVVPVPDEIKYQLPVAFVVAKPGTAPPRRRCAASPSTTAPPMPIRAQCGSSTSCRSRERTRSTARSWSTARWRPTPATRRGGSDSSADAVELEYNSRRLDRSAQRGWKTFFRGSAASSGKKVSPLRLAARGSGRDDGLL